jgi:hypothetical protein
MINAHHPAGVRIAKIPMYQDDKSHGIVIVCRILSDYDWILDCDPENFHGLAGNVIFEIRTIVSKDVVGWVNVKWQPGGGYTFFRADITNEPILR